MKLILVVGLTGAGKTTYCKKISSLEKAYIFSIDDWMKSLYSQDMPANPDMKWFQENSSWYLERISRCESFIKEQLALFYSIKTNVILDLGFTAKSHRLEYLKIAKKISSDSEIHFLDVPINERWKRVQQRNELKGDTFAMVVSRDMFDYIESIFEPISEEEMKICSNVIRTNG